MYAAHWLPSRFSPSVEVRRRYDWLRMVSPGVRPFRASIWCSPGGWRHTRGRENCVAESLVVLCRVGTHQIWRSQRTARSSTSQGRVEPREPLFATPCCNTSRATWSTPSEPSHKKPLFEVLSFSALFGPGCCCQLLCFQFGVLHFPFPIYTRNGQVGEHVRTLVVVFGFCLVLAGCCCQLVCFEFVVLHFCLPIQYPKTGRL